MLDYELVFLDRPENLGGMRVTVWFLDDDGNRTGLYEHIIDNGRIYIQGTDMCLQRIDDPDMPLRGGFGFVYNPLTLLD